MNIADFLMSLEATHLADKIRNSLLLFPLLEAFHVMGLTLVFGTAAIIDLRLLGIASSKRSFRRIASDTLKWTWAAFGLTGATGLLMFITNATVYYNNFFFRTKMVLLLLAGINMAIFELTAGRSIHRWDKEARAPAPARVAAVVSLLLWISIIFMGRWIGFTSTRVTSKPDPNINIEDLFPK
jgi:hypothetical protein